ncbi:hypothetical protein KSF_050360 [Reticulibacter mediterranei]|uniref:Uncharacterized protein n=1 Tax=Reticulibacter mediterranei TaxID=2778369 RepID=A0A8J3N415_9CHLR|nr:hypothetical protein [Reticulibacter mediterranei]GHO94988.1 hypothetical protein KSF_050360 [Reticulibacter mediterranei]
MVNAEEDEQSPRRSRAIYRGIPPMRDKSLDYDEEIVEVLLIDT